VLVLRGTSPWLLFAGAAAGVLAAMPEVCLALFITAGAFKDELAVILRTGSDLTLILAGLLAAGLIVRGVRSGIRNVLPPGRLALFLTLVVLVMVTALLTAEANVYGSEKTLRFVALTAPTALAAAALLRSDLVLHRFLFAFMALGLVMTAAGTVTGEGLRAFNATHIATGRVIGFGLIATVYFVGRWRRPAVMLPLISAGAAMVFGLLYSGSRGALAAFLVAMAATGLLLLGLRQRRRWAIAGLAATVTMVAVATVAAPDAVRFMNERLRGVNAAAPYTGATGARLNLAQAAVEMLAANPVFGVGPGGYSLELGGPDAPRGAYPHNILLEFGAEFGLVGLAAFLLLLGWALRHPLLALRPEAGAVESTPLPSRAKQPRAVLAVALLAYCLANALFSGDINDNRILFCAVGLAAATRQSPVANRGSEGG
jgi:O-antigen ligase